MLNASQRKFEYYLYGEYNVCTVHILVWGSSGIESQDTIDLLQNDFGVRYFSFAAYFSRNKFRHGMTHASAWKLGGCLYMVQQILDQTTEQCTSRE